MVQRLGYVGLGVSDIEAWERFATEILGFVTSGRADDGTLYLRQDSYHHRFALHPTAEDDIVYVGWEARGEGELQQLAERVTAAGIDATFATPSEATARGVVELLRFEDPGGLGHEVFFGLANIGELFVPPELEGRFRTGELGMGHLTLHVTDHDKHVEFYRDLLGMRRTSTRRLPEGAPIDAVSSWRCNRRHHSVAILGMREPAAQRLAHFGLHLNDIDDVGVAYDKAQDAGVVAVTLGRHQGDQVLSFYATTPSGFQVEYGWLGREILDDAPIDQVVGPPSKWGHRPVTSSREDNATFSAARGVTGVSRETET
jgi:2,3-dihydroxybiphenyl 1,2-dioxygenase